MHVLVFFVMVAFSSSAPLLVLYGFWLPQIVHNYRSGSTGGLRADYIWGMTVTRLWPVVYFKLYASNAFHIEPSPVGVCVLVGFVLVQAAVLTLQDRIGAGFFVPAIVRSFPISLSLSLTLTVSLTAAPCQVRLPPGIACRGAGSGLRDLHDAGDGRHRRGRLHGHAVRPRVSHAVSAAVDGGEDGVPDLQRRAGAGVNTRTQNNTDRIAKTFISLVLVSMRAHVLTA
jgi:hypothetical protein